MRRLFLCWFLPLVLAMAATPLMAQGMESEPNNDRESANSVDCDSETDGCIAPGDVDFFEVFLPANVCLEVSVEVTSGMEGDARLAIESAADDGCGIGVSTSGITGFFGPSLRLPRGVGSHIIIVTGDGDDDATGNHGKTFDYRLVVSCAPAHLVEYQFDGGGRIANNGGGQSTFRFLMSGIGLSCDSSPPLEVDDLSSIFGSLDAYNYVTRTRFQAFGATPWCISSFFVAPSSDPDIEWRAFVFGGENCFIRTSTGSIIPEVFVVNITKTKRLVNPFDIEIVGLISGASIRGKIISGLGTVGFSRIVH